MLGLATWQGCTPLLNTGFCVNILVAVGAWLVLL